MTLQAQLVVHAQFVVADLLVDILGKLYEDGRGLAFPLNQDVEVKGCDRHTRTYYPVTLRTNWDQTVITGNKIRAKAVGVFALRVTIEGVEVMVWLHAQAPKFPIPEGD